MVSLRNTARFSKRVAERPLGKQFELNGFQILVSVVSGAMTAVVAIGAFLVIHHLNSV